MPEFEAKLKLQNSKPEGGPSELVTVSNRTKKKMSDKVDIL